MEEQLQKQIQILNSRICKTCGTLFGRTDMLSVCPKCNNSNTITVQEYLQMRKS